MSQAEAYRFEDRAVSVADEYGDHLYSRTEVSCYTFPILNRTPCGIRIRDFGGQPRFINQKATKQYAHETKELAMVAFVARKRKQASIYRARADFADGAVEHARRQHRGVFDAAFPLEKDRPDALI